MTSVVRSAVLPVMKTHMSRPPQFRSVPVQIPKEEFKVAAEHLRVFLRKVAVAPVRFHMAGAEHPHKPLELDAVKREIESDHQQQSRFPQNELGHKNWHGRKAE